MLAFKLSPITKYRYSRVYGISPMHYLINTICTVSSYDYGRLEVLTGVITGIGSSYIFTADYLDQHIEFIFASDLNESLMEFNFRF